MEKEKSFADEIVEYLPKLRAFARVLSHDRALSDDLVQETVMRALSHSHQFRPGTNLKAWLITILRNSYRTEMRSHRRIVGLGTNMAEDIVASLSVSGGQESHLHMLDFMKAYDTLPDVQREALALVGASGMSHEEAAEQAVCATGTMKSRVFRARVQLNRLLDGDAATEDQASPVPSTPRRLKAPAAKPTAYHA